MDEAASGCWSRLVELVFGRCCCRRPAEAADVFGDPPQISDLSPVSVPVLAVKTNRFAPHSLEIKHQRS